MYDITTMRAAWGVEGSNMIKDQPYAKGDIIIGNDTWIGHEVTIIPGIMIGDGAIIGAKSRRYQGRGDIRDCGR